MNWYKITISLLPLLLVVLQISSGDLIKTPAIFNPSSNQNNNLNQFEETLRSANIQPTGLKFFGSRDEIEFSVDGATIIFSSKLSPLIQVTAFQNILKTSNIKGRGLKFIDLSSSHPYATFENN